MVKEEEEEAAAPLYGDVLETIISHVPLLDLICASHVSKAWQRAVTQSLRNSARVKPWLILHLQSRRNPSSTISHAYDPYSHVWIQISHVPTPEACILSSSHSNLFYMLCSSKLTLSCDSLNFVWESMGAPHVWRQCPVVAMVGPHVVVAGGACDFEDDPLAVEVLDTESGGGWVTCEPMPAIFKKSASATWLSVAVSDRKMYVLEKYSSEFSSFDLDTKKWGNTSELRPDPSVIFSVIAFSNNRLILFALIGDATDVNSLRLWEVNCDTLEHKAIGEMPSEMLERFKNTNLPLSLIGVSSAGDFAYIYNPSDPEEIFCCDFSSGVCEWWNMPNPILSDQNRLDRFMFTCSKVGIDDLRAVLRPRNRKFKPNLAGK